MEIGEIQVWVYTSRGKIPVSDATIVMIWHKNQKKEEVFAVEVSDATGRTQSLKLPVPSEEVSIEPSTERGYVLLDIWVEHPEFVTQKIENVQIFPNIETILPVELYPLGEGESSLGTEVEVELTKQDL